MRKKRIGVIGCGQWGPNQIRIFSTHEKTEVIQICDTDPGRLKANQSCYPAVEVTQKPQDITRSADIDAVVIVTPAYTHFEIAKDALNHGKDVLCEKPLALKTNQARELTQLADEKKLILMAGHVFLFNPGILKLKDLIESRECGDHYYLYAQRTNLGPVRRDVNAVYDLASHDIAIFNFLLGARPRVLQAVGRCYLQPDVEDVAFISLEYPPNIFAHIHISWLDPKKTRQITVVGSKKMMTWNDLSLSGPVEIYAKSVEMEPYYKDYGEFQLLVREGEIVIPRVKVIEPLKLQADHFVECLLTRKRPLSDGQSGIGVVEVLEEIEEILAKSRNMKMGMPVER